MKRKLVVSFLALPAILLGGFAIRQANAEPKVQTGKARPGKPEGIVAVAKISPALQAKLNSIGPADSAGLVIITANLPSSLTQVATAVSTLGATPGTKFTGIGVMTAVLSKTQVLTLQTNPAVKSLWDNYQLHYSLHQARILCGVDKLRADATGLTAANGGHVVDGSGAGDAVPNPDANQPNKPNITVVVIDSGLSTSGVPSGGSPTENVDLYYDNNAAAHGVLNPAGDGYLVPPVIPNSKVIQNVQVTPGVLTGDPSVYLENQVENDSVGHGSHCAGIVGGLGTFSKTTPAVTGPNASPTGPGVGLTEDFSGAANGVKIIGCGSGAGLFVLDALGGFNYAINFRTFYNVRVTSNSYGSNGPFDPADPLNVAIQTAYNNGITNVFAAGNDGPGVDTISNSSKSPYVISVAAGHKEGGLVAFSSRGKPAVERTVGSIDEFNLPAITAPGTGREFDFNAPGSPNGKGLYSDIISTRSKIPGAAAGTNDQEFPAPYQANYTQISGTSMACPFIAGVCALLLDANPSLTPAGIKAILQKTATMMPGYQDFEVGAGYVNAYAAVDAAFNPTKPYAVFNRIDAPYKSAYPAFVTNVNSAALAPPSSRPLIERPASASFGQPYPPPTVNNSGGHENFVINYAPSTAANTSDEARQKAETQNNTYAFLVDANPDNTPINPLNPTQSTSVLDVRIQFGNDTAAAGGNSLGLQLWDPDGNFYSSGPTLPVLDNPTRQVVVKNPKPGLWVAEVRGLRGLAAIPVTPPTGLGAPDTVNGQIFRTNLTVTNPPSDANNIPQTEAINFALVNRYLDQVTSGSFQPTAMVTRAAFVQVAADNMPLRQSLKGTGSAFNDVSGYQARQAEAAAQFGSTLRDFDFTPGPILPANSATFTPNSLVNRMQSAAAMVRALGLDKEAQNLAGTAVKVSYQGNMINVVDANLLAPADRGYLQLALNRGLITFTPSLKPDGVTYEARAFPNKSLTRADLAVNIVNFRNLFKAGNTLGTEELQPQNP